MTKVRRIDRVRRRLTIREGRRSDDAATAARFLAVANLAAGLSTVEVAVGRQRSLEPEFIAFPLDTCRVKPATPTVTFARLSSARAGRRALSRPLTGPRQTSPFKQRLATSPPQAASRNVISGSKLAGAP